MYDTEAALIHCRNKIDPLQECLAMMLVVNSHNPFHPSSLSSINFYFQRRNHPLEAGG